MYSDERYQTLLLLRDVMWEMMPDGEREFDSLFIGSYARALRELGKAGLVKVVRDDGDRGVLAVFPEEGK